MFGSSVSSTAVITTAAGSTRILCATICPHSSSSSSLIPTRHFTSHLLPTTNSVFSFLPLQIIIISLKKIILVQWYWF
jgi:hypothetical protein